MRRWIALGLLATGVLVATGQPLPLPAPASAPSPSPQQAGDLLGFASRGTDGGELITLIDATQRVMSVYHIDSQTGQITLRSVRRLTFDFAIEEFNSASPSPLEIRQMVGRRPPG